MRRVLAVVPDLFFATRIAATATAAGVDLEQSDLGHAAARSREAPPALVILDLHAPGDPLALVRELAAAPETRGIPVVGFYSHVDGALRAAALAAGVHHVLPRSAFTAKLAELLGGTLPRPSGA